MTPNTGTPPAVNRSLFERTSLIVPYLCHTVFTLVLYLVLSLARATTASYSTRCGVLMIRLDAAGVTSRQPSVPSHLQCRFCALAAWPALVLTQACMYRCFQSGQDPRTAVANWQSLINH